jgi:hypothetical protein
VMGSARLGFAADTVLLLEPRADTSDAASDVARMLLKVAKSRHGRKGTQIFLDFDHARCRFSESKGRPAAPKPNGPKKSARPVPRVRRLDPLGGK